MLQPAVFQGNVQDDKGNVQAGAQISVTSVLTGKTFPPKVLISSAVLYIVPVISLDSIAVLAAIVTVAPSLANARAIALPIPLLDPVTMATLFFNFMDCLFGT